MADIWLTAAARAALKELPPSQAQAVNDAIRSIGDEQGERLNIPAGPVAEPFLAMKSKDLIAPVVIYRRTTPDERGDWLVVSLMNPRNYDAARRAEQTLATQPAVRDVVNAVISGTVATVTVTAPPGHVTITPADGAAPTDPSEQARIERIATDAGKAADQAQNTPRVSHGTALTDDLFDEIEFEAARTGDYRRAALRMNHLAATAEQTGSMSRAEAYMRAGDQWLLADEPAIAVERYQLAMADGGATFADPRAPLARAMFALGRRDEGRALIHELDHEGAEGKRDPRTCDLIAELLAEQGDTGGALHWATAGADECRRRGDRAELRLLLSLRYRIRNDLGLPEDDYDRLLDELTSDTGGHGRLRRAKQADGPANA